MYLSNWDYTLEELLDEPEPDCECTYCGDEGDASMCEYHHPASGYNQRQRILRDMLEAQAIEPAPAASTPESEAA